MTNSFDPEPWILSLAAVARWKGAMTLTEEQETAVEACLKQDDLARRSTRARDMLAALPAGERRRILAELGQETS